MPPASQAVLLNSVVVMIKCIDPLPGCQAMSWPLVITF
jgi:hypothetical protein